MKVVVYSKTHCPYCVRAKEWLSSHSVPYESIVLDDDAQRQAFYAEHGGQFGTVPQIFVDGVRIGGYTEMLGSEFAKTIQAGKFDADF